MSFKMSQFYQCMKKVHFNPNVEVLHMHAWAFAYRKARTSEWRSIVLDRHRFEHRKQLLEKELEKIEFFTKKNQE